MKAVIVVTSLLWAILAVAAFTGVFTPSSFAVGVSYVVILLQHIIISGEAPK